MPDTARMVIVTGAGGGIGAAICQRLAEAGYAVAATDVDEEAAGRTAQAIRSSGGRGDSYRMDVTSGESIRESLEAAVSELGPLGAWVSNAGVSSMRPFLELPEQDWDFNMNVNAKGPFLCGQIAAERFVKQGEGGVIVNLASMAAKKGAAPYLAHYVASKFAVVGLTQAMALELAEHGIKVNSVCPGYVETAMQERELEWEASLRGTSPRAVKEGWIAETPLGRVQKPEDVAGVVAFLVGEGAEFMTGEAVSVNGGVHMD